MLKLVSINIERSKHLDRVSAFLQKYRPDIVCMQELMERDIPHFEKIIGAPSLYSPGTRHDAEGNPGVMGIGTFSRFPVRSHEIRCYAGSIDHIPDFDFTNAETKHSTENHTVLFTDIDVGNELFRVGVTHFTWTPHGEADDLQREDVQKLLPILAAAGDFVLVGDFNAPRGGEIFSIIAEKYKDNVPLQYETSIDLNLHRWGKERPHELRNKMVDGLFSTAAYRVSDVELIFGVSDHAAVVATISKM